MIDEKKLIEELLWKMPKEFGFTTMQWFRELVDSHPKVGEWIPCSERLPKTKGNYLVTVTDCDGIHIEIGHFDPEDSYDVDFWGTGLDIVAWQPLPEPWEGEEG